MAEEFKEVPVVKAWDEGPRLRALLLDLAGTGFRAAFTAPGQYLSVQPLVAASDSKPAFMAMASGPGNEQVELLVQRTGTGTVADQIAGCNPGDRLSINAPAGKGFPVEVARGGDLLLLAGGTGISAIRSVVEYVAGKRAEYGRVMLAIGARAEDDLAYRHLFDQWRGLAIEVEPSLSRPASGKWTGRVGYVTGMFRDLGLDASRTRVFMAGGREFQAASREALAALGIGEERVFKNY